MLKKPLSKEEFQELRRQGLTINQIVKFEEGYIPPEFETSPPKERFGLLKSLVTRVGQFGEQVGIGALKGVTRTFRELGGLAERGVKAVLPRRAEEAFGLAPGRETVARELIPEEAITPETTLEQVGLTAEQIGEFFIPLGKAKEARAVLKGTKFIANLAKGGKVAKFTSRVLPRILPEMASDLAVSIAQGADEKQLAMVATLNAGIPIAGEVLRLATAPIKKVLTETIAPNMLNRIIRPLEKAFHFGKNPGRGVVEEGITANTRGGLLKNITNKARSLGRQLNNVLTGAKAKTAGIKDKIIEPLDRAIREAIESGEQTLVNRLNDVKNGLTKNFKLVGGKLQEIGDKNLDNLTPLQITNIKRAVGKATKWTGQAFDNAVNQVRVQIYRNLDDVVDNLVPATEKLNSRIANLIGAEKFLDRANNIRVRQAFLRATEIGVGTLVGLGARGAGTPQAIITGIGTALGIKAFRSPAVQTRLAQRIFKLGTQEKTLLARSVPILRRIFFGWQSKKED